MKTLASSWCARPRDSMAATVSDVATRALGEALGECEGKAHDSGATFAAHGSVLGERSMATLAGLSLLPPPLLARNAPAFEVFLRLVRTRGSSSGSNALPAAVPMRRAALAAACNVVRHVSAALPSVRTLHHADRVDLLHRLCSFRRTLLDALPGTAAAILEAQAGALAATITC